MTRVLVPPACLAVALLLTLAVYRGEASPRVRRARRSTHTSALLDTEQTAAIGRLVDERQGQVTIAVDDLLTGKEWLFNPGARDQTGSIIKVDILETLLRQAMEQRTPLGESVAETAEGMIENSNNDDATALWDQDGGAGGVGSYNRAVGLDQTTLNTDGYWGTSLTSAADQIKLLRQLTLPGGLLDAASREYELGLMENIEADQDWGVSAGIPSGVRVALKNGWLPLTTNTNWEINSIGWIKGDGRDYLIAVLTAHDPSEAYGISTVQSISPLVYADLAPS
ncbi:MAG TPA: serine hydrolase [Solirubrobacteraceae bacterium]|nr:serine hydrolase [Solirubrobacteraceae bacterium]